MHVEDAGAGALDLRADVLDEARVERAAPEHPRGDSLGAQGPGRLILVFEPGEVGHIPFLVVAGKPPGEQSGDPVNAGSGDAKLVADVEDGSGHVQIYPALADHTPSAPFLRRARFAYHSRTHRERHP